MGWVGNLFSRVHNWSFDASAGIDILASRMDQEDDNFAAGITECINKGGLNSPTADLDMASLRHINVGGATSRECYAKAAEVQDGLYNWGGTSTGTVNAHVLTGVGGVVGFQASYPTGGFVYWISGQGPNTGPTSLAVNSGGAKQIYHNGAVLSGGEIEVNQLVECIYDGVRWQLVNAGAGGGSGFLPFSCRVQLTSDQGSIGRLAPTLVVWDVAQWDDAGFFPVGNSADLVIPETGRYLIEGNLTPPGGLSVPDNYVIFANFIVNANPLSGSDSLFSHTTGDEAIPSAVKGAVQPLMEIELTAGDIVQCQFTWDYPTTYGTLNWILDGNAGIGEGCWMVIRRTG